MENVEKEQGRRVKGYEVWSEKEETKLQKESG